MNKWTNNKNANIQFKSNNSILPFRIFGKIVYILHKMVYNFFCWAPFYYEPYVCVQKNQVVVNKHSHLNALNFITTKVVVVLCIFSFILFSFLRHIISHLILCVYIYYHTHQRNTFRKITPLLCQRYLLVYCVYCNRFATWMSKI